jgi:hypothetical protein
MKGRYYVLFLKYTIVIPAKSAILNPNKEWIPHQVRNDKIL